MNLSTEGERCVCVCVCACACIHLLTCFLKHFRSSHGSPGNHREELPYPALPNSGAPAFCGGGVACGQQHFLPCPLLCGYLSSILYFFFCQFLNFIWPCLERGMSTSPRRIYKEEEPAGRNESGVRNLQQETSGAPPPSPGS